MTVAQQRCLVQWMPHIGLAYQPQPLDLGRVFGRHAPTILEVGFGMGESTATIAELRPDEDFIAVEVHGPGVGNLCKLVAAKGLRNLRIIQHDAVEVLHNMTGEATLAGVHVFFPDPWHKKRHHKRRIIQADFVALVASRLAPGGYIHCATDWQEYAEWMLATLSAQPMLHNTASGYAARPAYRPLTKFEQRGLRLGHGVWDLVFRRG